MNTKFLLAVFLTLGLAAANLFAAPKEGDLILAPSGAVSIIRDGKRCLIPGVGVFDASGFKWEDVIKVSDEEVNAIPEGPVFTVASNSPGPNAPIQPNKTAVVSPPVTGSLRYRPEAEEIVIRNGKYRFNRPLYGGTHGAFSIYAGDLPEVLLWLPGNGGTLMLGLVSGSDSKWLASADEVVARYRGGAMRYEVRDQMLGGATLTLDVLPMAEAEGAVIRATLSANAPPVELIWAFGGAFAFQGNKPEVNYQLKSGDCRGNAIALRSGGFDLRADSLKKGDKRHVAGTVPVGAELRVGSADALATPLTLWASSPNDLPILAGRCKLAAGEPQWLGLEWLTEAKPPLTPAQLPEIFSKAGDRRSQVVGQVRVRVPDPYLNAAIPALCSAAEEIWQPSVYLHGTEDFRSPYLGWRGAYVASTLGWQDRARAHFRTFAKVQYQEPADGKPQAAPDYFALQSEDSGMYSRGHIPHFPDPKLHGLYNMQEVYIDQLLWHLQWTGELEFAREMWPVLTNHLEWEKRCFDPDDDGLYENYANTFISDGHHYSGGGCAQASAYTYRALCGAARLAERLGHDPVPWRKEAQKTLDAMNRVLWLPQSGWYAEYRDLLGLGRLHPSAELPSIYHPIDSAMPDKFQAWQMLRYVDTELEHVPVEGKSNIVWSSNWVPYQWSTRSLIEGDIAHTALAYWQSGCRQKAFDLFRGAVIDSMYCGRVPGASFCVSPKDPRAPGGKDSGGAHFEFADTVGMFARALVEGLFGIVPDALAGELLIRPGLPADWNSASLDTPDVGYDFRRNGDVDEWTVRCHIPGPMRLRLQAVARSARVAAVMVNGKPAVWKNTDSVGDPAIEVGVPQADGAVIQIRWAGNALAELQYPEVLAAGETFEVKAGRATIQEVRDPQQVFTHAQISGGSLQATLGNNLGQRTAFVRVQQDDVTSWRPMDMEVRSPLEIREVRRDGDVVRFSLANHGPEPIATAATVVCGSANQTVQLKAAARSSTPEITIPASGLFPGTNPIEIRLDDGRTVRGKLVDWSPAKNDARLECLNLGKYFNDRVSEIFGHDYRSPRSPYCSLQIPVHLLGSWCSAFGWRHGKPPGKFPLDDLAIRTVAGQEARFIGPAGIPLATPGPGTAPNVIFTSQWDNFPKQVEIPVSGNARHAWFLVAGSANVMHSQLDNGEIEVAYTDGSTERLPMHQPSTWWPITDDYDLLVDSFCIPGPHPPRIQLGTNARATLLDLPLDSRRELRSITLRCLANEVVVGLMAVTLARE